jgi:hypothetical protein
MNYGDYLSRRQAAIAVGVVASGVVLWHLSNTPSAKARRAKAKLPPGPKGNFIVGNLFNFPKNRWYDAFTRWKDEFGMSVCTFIHGRAIHKGLK